MNTLIAVRFAKRTARCRARVGNPTGRRTLILFDKRSDGMDQAIDAWLTRWTADNLDPMAQATEKSDVQDLARRLIEAAGAAGYPVTVVKVAAHGDIEQYLLTAINSRHVAD